MAEAQNDAYLMAFIQKWCLLNGVHTEGEYFLSHSYVLIISRCLWIYKIIPVVVVMEGVYVKFWIFAEWEVTKIEQVQTRGREVQILVILWEHNN